MCPLPISRSEPESLEAILPARPDLNRLLEQQVEVGFPPELALDLILNELVVRAVDATRASAAALALVRGGEMVCRAATGLHAPDLGVPLNTRDGLSGACLHTHEPQFCVDTESDLRVDAAIARRLGIRSMLIVPVLDDENLIGVLEVFSSEPAAFSHRELAMLEESAADCARIRQAAAELGKRPPAALKFLSVDPFPSHRETPQLQLPLFDDVARSPSRYEKWTLVLGALVILAAVALSFLVGFRSGWLKSSPPSAQVQTSPSAISHAVQAAAPPVPPAAKATPPIRQADAKSATQPPRARVMDELVVYDHGRVIFRVPTTSQKSGANPVVAASESTRIPRSHGVWLAPEQAERRLRNRVEPQYPTGALAAHSSGDVVLEVLVAEDGSVASIRALSGDALLGAAAADAVRQWRYEPYLQHKQPSAFQTDVSLKFTLPN